MYQEKVIIKQIPDDYAEATGLARYNRSRMPRCVDRLCAAQQRDGRYITGIDEDALDVNMIPDPITREERKEELRNLRKSLETNTGLDLSALSPFWENFFVEIKSDSDLILNRANPSDVIKFYLLVSNGYVAPSKDEAGNPKFMSAKYFVFTTEVENKEKVSTRKIKDKARAALLNLSEKPETMLLIGQFLEGPKYMKGLEPDTLYSMLSDYIEVNKDNAVQKFLKAVEKDVAELQYKVTIDRAVRAKIIKFRDKYYQRGQVTLGKSIEEVYSTLQSPEYAAEFLSIKEELDNR